MVESNRSAILQGTLDLMVLKTLEQMGPMHGYGIARRIEQVGRDALVVNQGTVYLCLVRLVQKGWITARWGVSEQQPQGQVLLDHGGRASRNCRPRPRTGSASRASSAACCSRRAGAEACGPCSTRWRRGFETSFRR